jgi:hypothetical protein
VTWSFISLPDEVIVGESRDSSIPHTLLDWCASALLLILSAEFLHSLEASGAARANLELLVNVGPIRRLDTTTTTAAIVKLTVDMSFFISKICTICLLIGGLT